MISDDGKYVAYASYANNLMSGVDGTATLNVYRRELSSGAHTLISAANGKGVGGDKPSISGDGRLIAFLSQSSLDPRFASSGVFVYDRNLL